MKDQDNDDIVKIFARQSGRTCERVASLGCAYTHKGFESLIRSGQLCVNPNRKLLARLIINDGVSKSLVIGNQRLTRDLFTSTGRFEDSPRILGFFNDEVLVLAALDDGRAGVFLFGKETMERFSKGECVVGVHHSASGPIIFTRFSGDQKNERRLVIPSLKSDVVVHEDAFVIGISSGRTLVLDRINGRLFRYLIGPEGFEDVCQVTIPPDSRIVGVVQWNGMYLLGTQKNSCSEIWSLGVKGWDIPKQKFEIPGELECMWQSPTQQSFAYLINVVRNGYRERRLMNNTKIVFWDRFSMNTKHVVWSPNGRKIAALIETEIDGENVSAIVSDNEFVRSKHSKTEVNDFCVDDGGNIVAWIAKTGGFHYPSIRLCDHYVVVYAWNMRLMADGAVGYNCVIDSDVYNITDRTDVRSDS